MTGDRLGVAMEKVPGAIAYTFDASSPMALGYTATNVSNPTSLGQDVLFASLTFPYDFSMSAYVDTGESLKQGHCFAIGTSNEWKL